MMTFHRTSFIVRTQRAAVVSFGLAAFSNPLQAQTAAPDPAGVYVGSYICNQQQMSLQLTLEPPTGGDLSAVFAFYLPGGTASPPLGAFQMKGTFDPASGAFRLRPGSWIKAAPGYRPVALSGSYDARTGRLTGRIQGYGCTTFDVRRDETATARVRGEVAERAERYVNAPTALAQARGFEEQCLVFAKWAAGFTREYPELDTMHTRADQVSDRAVNLFGDDSFVPVFGQPFDSLSDQERTALRTTLIRCSQTLTDRVQRTFYSVTLISTFLRGETAAKVAYRRTLRRQLADLLRELPSATFERASNVRDSELKTYDVLWPSEYRRLEEAVDTAMATAAAPGLDAWVDELVAKAAGYEGLAGLTQALSRIAFSGSAPAHRSTGRRVPDVRQARREAETGLDSLLASAAPDARDRAREKLQLRAHALVAELAASERAQLAKLGSGAEALKAGTAWYARITSSFAQYQSEPAVRDALTAFETRRAQDLAAGADALLARVNQAETSQQVTGIVSSHLGVPSDRSHPAGSRVLSAAAARGKALAAAAEQAAEDARSVTNFCTTLKQADSAAAGEPSARDICLAIADRFDGINDTYRERAAACRRGDFKHNPMLAIQCLQLCGGTGGSCEVSFNLTRFQKIACEKAQGQPGYVCDYVVNYSASSPVVQQAMSSILGSGTAAQGRFVPAPGGWIQLNR